MNWNGTELRTRREEWPSLLLVGLQAANKNQSDKVYNLEAPSIYLVHIVSADKAIAWKFEFISIRTLGNDKLGVRDLVQKIDQSLQFVHINGEQWTF